MSELAEPVPKRPLIITILCVFVGLGGLLALPVAFYASRKLGQEFGAWYPRYLILSAILGLFCCYGYWRMRRWAVFLYSAFFVVNLGVLLATGQAHSVGVIYPLIMIACGFIYLRRMQ
jgi:hypothetical protein